MDLKGSNSYLSVSSEDECVKFPTHNRLETELMPNKDHVLVVGDHLRKPLVSLNSIPGFDLIKENLKEELDVEVGNALQLHAASYILGGRNCFLIGSAGVCGKSLSYIIPIVSKLRLDINNGAKASGNGPLALVVASTSESCSKIEENWLRLVEDSDVVVELVEDKDTGVDDYVHARCRPSWWSEWERRCDVMVATAECAAAVIDDPTSWFRFDRLTYLIFDDAHILLKYRLGYVRRILEAFNLYLSKVEHRKCLCQIIICGSQWGFEMEDCFQHLTSDPVLIMTSPVQAIKFGGFEIEVLEVTHNTRFERFKELLKKHEEATRIIVVANKWETLDELRLRCHSESMDIYFLIGEGYIGTSMSTVRRKWNENPSRKMIICITDVILRDLQIQDAALLIHYDVPADDFRTFALRFSCMWSVVESRVTNRMKNRDISSHMNDTLSYVLLLQELPEKHSIVWKLNGMGARVSSTLREEARQIRESCLDRNKLCQGFLTAANCVHLDVMECSYRHHFTKSDFEDERVLPCTGQVELLITEVKAPNVYMAKLLRYCDRDTGTNEVIKCIDFAAETLRRHQMLAKITDEMRNGPSTVKPGTKVVVALRDKQEYRYVHTRAEVEAVVTRTASGFPKTIQVKCIDIGETMLVRVDDVFAMPPEMESLPPCSVIVILANTVPPYGEKKFRTSHLRKAKDFFKLNPTCHAEISLSISNTIWVRRLVKMKKLSSGKFVEHWDATFELCRKNILERKRNHLELLYKSCEDVGFSCAVYRNVKKLLWLHDTDFRLEYHQMNDPYQWAYLQLHSDSHIVSSTVSPKFVDRENHVYVNLVDFEPLVEKLELELTSDILRRKALRDWNLEDGFSQYYKNGLVVAAIDVDEVYRRGLILGVEGSVGTTETLCFRILLVDLGVGAWLPISSIFPIPTQFVWRLPFQAIKLKLAHIRPLRPRSSKDKIHLRTAEILMSKPFPDDVEVVALRKFERCKNEDSNCYEAFIFGDRGEVGAALVAKNAAVFLGDGAERVQHVKQLLHRKFEKLTGEIADDYEEANEDDISSDGFDVNFGDAFIDEFIKQMKDVAQTELHAVGGKPKVVESLKNKEREGCSHLQIPDSNKTVQSQARLANKPPKTQHEIDGLKKANITWLQNNVSIFIRVLIPDVSEYDCKLLNSKTIKFEAVKPPNYGFTLLLLFRVESQVEVRLYGQYCEIKLIKRRPAKWDVLTPVSGLKWIKPELSIMDDDYDNDDGGDGPLVTSIPVDYEALCADESDEDAEIYEINDERDEYLE